MEAVDLAKDYDCLGDFDVTVVGYRAGKGQIALTLLESQSGTTLLRTSIGNVRSGRNGATEAESEHISNIQQGIKELLHA